MFEGNPTLRGAGETFEYTPEMIKEIIRCKEDILYFAENYFYIQNLDKGKIKIPLWGFQKQLIKVIKDPPNNKKHICILAARQMSKTTVTTIYLLHEMLFKKDYTIAVLANREATAIEILGRIQMAYSLLPLWLQRGVIIYNKKEVLLENGVRILASSTSSNSIRGYSINCVDERGVVTIQNNNGKIETISIKKLKQMTKYIGIVENKLLYENIHNFKVLTDVGYKDFYGISSIKQETIKLVFESGIEIVTTPEHKLFDENLQKYNAEDFVGKISYSIGKNKDKCIKKETCEMREVCDLINVADVNRFYYNSKLISNCIFVDECSFIFDYIWEDFQASVMPTISSSKNGKIILVSTPNGLNHFYNIYKAGVLGENDFYSVKLPWHLHPDRDERWKESVLKSGFSLQQFQQEYNCKFLGSSSQLIEADKLEELTPREPVDISHYSGALQIYEQPIEGEKYILGVDPGKGSGNDYSVIQVLKIVSEYEIHQVAVFRSNYIKIDKLVDITIGISDFYNECEVMAESNDVGELFCSDLWNKKSFDRLLNCDKKGLGIRATKKSKLEGNLLLKKYIENDWLTVCDKRTIYELSRYIEVSPNVFHAEGQNENDDCVSSLLWGLYYITTDFYDKTETKATDESDKNSFSGFAIMDGNVVGGGFDEYGFGNGDFGNFGGYNNQFGIL